MCKFDGQGRLKRCRSFEKNETARNLTEKGFGLVTYSSDEAGGVQGVPVWRIETLQRSHEDSRAFFGKEQSFLIDKKA